jgi:hypothetical protein
VISVLWYKSSVWTEKAFLKYCQASFSESWNDEGDSIETPISLALQPMARTALYKAYQERFEVGLDFRKISTPWSKRERQSIGRPLHRESFH